MAKTKISTSKPVKKKAARKRLVKKKWSDQQLAVKKLFEEELHGLLQYLSAIHFMAVIIIISSVASLMFALSVVFQNDHKAVVGFLVIISTSLVVSIAAALVLRPWIYPRFLLPMDLHSIDLKQLEDLFRDPEEYLILLKEHIQILTDQYLIPKLHRLRNTIILFIFGMATSVLLSIALP